MLGMAGVMKLMTLATELAGAERAGCRMTSDRESSRDRRHQTLIDAGRCGHGCWRNHLLYRLAPAEGC
jgi:hypothetical protein